MNDYLSYHLPSSFLLAYLTKALNSPILLFTLALKLKPYFFPHLICNK